MTAAYDARCKPADRLPPVAPAPTPMKKTTKPKKVVNRFPSGWDEKRVQQLIAHYENQTEEEAVAEQEAALAPDRTSMIDR